MQGLPGSGKTTLTHSLSQTFPSLSPFDFDEIMPPQFKEKMKNGQPITPQEREHLFELVYAKLDEMLQNGPVIGAMQLLKNFHRENLQKRYGPKFLLFSLNASVPILQKRLSNRAGHWFNPNVLEALAAANEKSSIPCVDLNAEQEKSEILDQASAVIKEKCNL